MRKPGKLLGGGKRLKEATRRKGRTRAEEVIKKVKSSNPELCKLGKCVEFANAGEKALKQKGISGTRVRVSNGGSVGFDGKPISGNGVHEFLDVNRKVYDNLNSGLSRKDFLNRFDVSNPKRILESWNF
ncbi:hypothetical protein MNBD_GAMMA12-3399 [hydrothermal vent metagenome]|uniref:Tox-PL-2 domain-containing protein n=1 Tax=hydrothermal vent metagenome TaxID=652676 RepID=A0A3B0YKM6_9ZZZZ